MNITVETLIGVSAEMGRYLPGSTLVKVTPYGSGGWVFSFKQEKKRYQLLVAVTPRFSRTYLLTNPAENVGELDPFGQAIKKKCGGGYLSAVMVVGADRVFSLTFETGSGTWTMVAELMGSVGNAYLLDEKGTITTALYPRGRNRVGQHYVAPPPLVVSDSNSASVIHSPSRGLANNRALEAAYGDAPMEELVTLAKTAALRPFTHDKKRLTKKKKTLLVDKEALQKNRDHKKWGDLLSAHYHQLHKGMTAVEVGDDFAGGEPVTILLDPALSPQENVQRYYKGYRKYEKGIPRLNEEMRLVAEQIDRIDQAIVAVERAKTVAEIPLAPPPKRPVTLEVKRPKGAKGAKGKEPQKAPGRLFVSSEGYPVLVGRNDRENDQLSGSFANGRDVWLHVRDYPGSHVLIRLPKNVEPPHSSIREAAMLALRYSKLSNAGKGTVTWAQAKNVKKPKGFKAGQVTVAAAKSVTVNIDDTVIDAMRKRAEGEEGVDEG
jgi:predicted ribosome quality control (RQC) complex YloA/Tae2 family protein